MYVLISSDMRKVLLTTFPLGTPQQMVPKLNMNTPIDGDDIRRKASLT